MRYKKDLSSGKNQIEDFDEGLINLTPLIDVVFVVLISFMIIAPMVETESIDLAPAGAFSNKISSKDHVLKIYVKKDNSIWVHNKSVTLQELKQVANHCKSSKTSKPTLFYDEKASFGMYQRIKNLLESCGYEQMEIVVSPTYGK